MGKCPQCGEWNTLVEEELTDKASAAPISMREGKPISFDAIEIGTLYKKRCNIGELDRVLGGGIVEGSLVLVGGDPGIGKSTILLQMAHNLASSNMRVLYVTGEESAVQLKIRGERLGVGGAHLLIYPEVILEKIKEQIFFLSPGLVIIDSIQSVFSSRIDAPPGSVSQIRHCAGTLMEIAKGMNIPVFVIGHVTKDGWIAGPKMLEHLVDTVLYFEGDTSGAFRVLRTVKNRFGPTGEIGVFEMKANGLVEVKDPSGVFIHGLGGDLSGSAVMTTIEGTRAFVVEVQSLVSRTTFSMPKRISIGVDLSRISVLLAVMEKRAGLAFSNADVVISVAGGIKVTEPAADLAVVMAIASSALDKPLPKGMIFIGEVGLNGEIRAVSRIETRINEARKMGFSTVTIPDVNVLRLDKPPAKAGIRLVPVVHIKDAFDLFEAKV